MATIYTTSNVWPIWVNCTTTGTTNSSLIWQTWNTSTVTTCSITVPSNTWVHWVRQTNQHGVVHEYIEHLPVSPAQRVLDEAQLEVQREWMAREAEARRVREAEYKAREEKLQAAVTRAERLLREVLSEVQRKEYDQHKAFHVDSPSGKRYRITRHRSHNVMLLDKHGKATHRLCCHPGLRVPDADTMITQKLMLENLVSEQDFLRLANRSPA
jgi:hypothetical protein